MLFVACLQLSLYGQTANAQAIAGYGAMHHPVVSKTGMVAV
jgi:hypothetical protein